MKANSNTPKTNFSVDKLNQIGLTRMMIAIINGLSLNEVKITEQIGSLKSVVNFFSQAFISLEEFAYLYFILPDERFNEFEKHLKDMASDFVGWQIFYNQHKNSDGAVLEMALKEMLKSAKSFDHYRSISRMTEKYPELKSEALKEMKLQAQKFEEKLTAIIENVEPPNHEEIKNLFSSANNFKHYETLAGLAWIPQEFKSKAIRRMRETADSYEKNAKTFHKAKPGSTIRRKCVANADNYELSFEDNINAYYAEKRWNNLKRLLLKKIDLLSLGVRDWFRILDCHDKKMKELVKRKVTDLNLSFDQLSEIQTNNLDAEMEIFLLEEMCRRADEENFAQWKKICQRAKKFPKIKNHAFPRLISIIKDAREGEELSELLDKNSQHGRNLFKAIAKFKNTPFEVFDNLSQNSSTRVQAALMPYLRRSANNFSQKERAFVLCAKNKKQQDLCLLEMLETAERSGQTEHLVKTYKLALETKNQNVAEKIITKIKVGGNNFDFLDDLHSQLKKANAANNGLANLTENLLIETAKTEKQKAKAFMNVSFEKKKSALQLIIN